MANVNFPSGLNPIRGYSGGEVRTNQYSIASGLAANIFLGDPVKSTGTGKGITLATATDAVIGAFGGVTYTLPSGEIVFSKMWSTGQTTKAGTDVIALVYDDPTIIYEVQTSGAFTAGDIGSQASYLIGAGNANTGTSTTQLDSASVTASNATPLPLKIIDIVPRPDVDFTANAKVLVLINKHELLSNTRLAV
jgi:hypothetical protein